MTLYLIDASGLVHRAFHAIRGLTNSRGQPTNAIFGLASMLKKFLADNRPTHCAVVLDVGRETFRNRLYERYKANRPETDPGLASQFQYVPRLATAMGFKVLSLQDWEADDVIATLASRAVAAGMDVVIESGDKDLLQLVDDRVAVHDPMKDKTYDREGVFEKMGVYPEFVRDYLALVGDSSDNVPGVAGIGAKGAAELVNRFGGLEEILARAEEASGRARTALAEHAADGRLSYRLVTLDCDAPVEADINDLTLGAPDLDELERLYSELEFRKMLAEIRARRPDGTGASSGAASGRPQPAGQPDLFGGEPDGEPDGGDAVPEPCIRVAPATRTLVPDRAELAGILAGAANTGCELAFSDWNDLTTAALQPDGTCIVFGLRDAVAAAPEALRALLANWSGAGFKELTRSVAAFGMEPSPPRFDPVLAAYLLDAGRGQFGLDEVIEHTNGVRPPAWDGQPESLAARAAASRETGEALARQVSGYGLDYLLHEVEIPLAGLLGRMEKKGVLVDRNALAGLSRSLGDALRLVEKQIIDAAGIAFNPLSPKQLADVLFGKLGLPTGKKKSSGYSTDVKVLEELAGLHPVPRLVLEYRSLSKLKGTYADALHDLVDPADGRLHTTFNQTVTATGRLSSSDPNLQNIPIRTEAGRGIRHAFRAPEGRMFVSADYSQIELRVLAHFARDEFLADAFRQGRDIHSETARKIFKVTGDVSAEQRRVAKVVNFGLLYGMGPFRLAGDLKISQGEAKQIIDGYFSAFPGIKAFMAAAVETTRATGFSTTMFGRRRGIADINSPNHQMRTAAERMALNMPVQGTAADIIKIAMVRLDRRLRAEGIHADIVLQVHDELVLEVDEPDVAPASRILRSEMESAATLYVPLVAEPGIGVWWDELH